MTLPRCKILVVDDDAADRKAIRHALRGAQERFDINEANSLNSGLEHLSTASPVDCMVLDYRLPDGDAGTLLSQLQDCDSGVTSVPVVVITGADDEHIGPLSLQQGAQDYLSKRDVNSYTLSRAIRYAIERHALRRSLRNQELQLRQSRKLEAIGQLAGGIAHDFNNMLTVIIGFTNRALERVSNTSASEWESEAARADLQQVLRAAERSAELTQQILAFARKQTLTTQVVDLGGLVKEAEILLGRVLGDRLELECNVETGAYVHVDAAQVGQVIMNLTLNARDSMPSGGRLTIAVSSQGHAPETSQLPAGHCVRLTVADTGCGVAPDELERIFDPFFTTKAPGEGTGLGLSVVHGIVTQCGGEISVASQLGSGTTFEVLFPRVDPPVVSQPSEASPKGPQGGETLLVVESEDLVRELIRETLEFAGYRVLPAASAAEARELCSQFTESVDLLITDLALPTIAGSKLASELRESRPNLRVLFMSGYSSRADLATSLTPEAHVIQKPMRPRALHAKVREVFGHAPPGSCRD